MTTLPSELEINPFPGDPDGETAVRNFLGKSAERITREFSRYGMSYSEDLLWMGPSAFCFYFPAALDYIASPESHGNPDVVSSLCGYIEFRLEHEREKLRDAFPSILRFVSIVENNYDVYELSPEFYGDLRPRLEAIRQTLTRTQDS